MNKLLKYLAFALVLISCGDGRLSPQGGSITGVTAGTGVTGGGTSGAVTINVIAGNGLDADANEMKLEPCVTTGHAWVWNGSTFACAATGTLDGTGTGGRSTRWSDVDTLATGAFTDDGTNASITGLLTGTAVALTTTAGIKLTLKSTSSPNKGSSIRWIDNANTAMWTMGSDYDGDGDQSWYLYDNVNTDPYIKFEPTGTSFVSMGATFGGFEYVNSTHLLNFFSNGTNWCSLNDTGVFNCTGGLQVNGTSVLTALTVSSDFSGNGTSGTPLDLSTAVTAPGSVAVATTLGVVGNTFVATSGGNTTTGYLHVGQDTNDATGARNGLSFQASSDGNNHIDSKSFAGGSTVFRYGEGVEGGASRVWLTVDHTLGATQFAGTMGVTGTLTASNDFAASAASATRRVDIAGGVSTLRYDDNSLTRNVGINNRGIDTAGQGVGISFGLAAGAAASVPALAIDALTENTTFTGASADGKLSIKIAENGTLTERLAVTSAGVGTYTGTMTISGNLSAGDADGDVITLWGVTTIKNSGVDSNTALTIQNDARSWQLFAIGAIGDQFAIYDGTAAAYSMTAQINGGLVAFPGSGGVTISGLLTATAGVTTPANLTTTGTGDVVSADAIQSGGVIIAGNNIYMVAGNEFHGMSGTNADADVYFNYYSNGNAGTSYFRNSNFGDGKGASACYLTAASKSLNCVGGLTENGSPALSGTISANTIPKGSGGNLVDSNLTESSSSLRLADTGGASVLIVGDPLASVGATDWYWSAQPYSDGNVYLDAKLGNAGSIIHRTGHNTENGATRTWLTVTGSNGNAAFGAAGSFTGNLSTDANLTVLGTIADTNSDVTIADGFQVTGARTATNSTLNMGFVTNTATIGANGAAGSNIVFRTSTAGGVDATAMTLDYSQGATVVADIVSSTGNITSTSGTFRGAGAWLGDTANSSIANNLDVLTIGNTGTGQTTSGTMVIRATHSGSWDTTAAAKEHAVVLAQNTATRLAGANNLSNYGIWALASGGQVNIAVRANGTEYSFYGDGGAIYNLGNLSTDGNLTAGNDAGDAHVLNGTVNAMNALVVNGTLRGVAAFELTGVVSDTTAAAATTNNYSLSGTVAVVRWVASGGTCSGPWTITGIGSPTAGRVVTFVNYYGGNCSMVFKHENGGSSAANQIIGDGAGDVVVSGVGSNVTFWYDNTYTRWRVLSLQTQTRSVALLNYDSTSLTRTFTISNNGIDSAGDGNGIAFSLGASGATMVAAASIDALSENATHTGATADGTISIKTALNGTLTERLKITSDGTTTIGGYTQITQAADQDVTNLGVTDSDTFLITTAAGKIYAIDALIIAGGNNTTGDYAFDFAVAAGTMDCTGTEQSVTTADAIQDTTIIATAAADTADTSVGTRADASLPIAIRIAIACKVSNTTTLKYRFGNASAAAARTSRTMAGSYIKWKQLN